MKMNIQIPWPVYVVSLRSAAVRRARCAETLGRLGVSFDFFDAVDGAALSEAEMAAVYDAERNAREFKRPLSRGEIGCALSHYELWKRIAADEHGGAVILEDDFEAAEQLPELLRQICSAPLENCMVKLFALGPVGGPQVALLSDGYRLVMPDRVPGQTLGYTVDRAAAAALAALALPMGRPVDMEIKHWWQFDVPVLVVQPTALRVNLKQTGSAIETDRKKTRPGGGLGWMTRAMRNLRYQWAYNVAAMQAARRGQQISRQFRARMIQKKREGKMP
jgi:glycosyl transferase family 25